MNTKFMRGFSLILALTLALSLMSVSVFAAHESSSLDVNYYLREPDGDHTIIYRDSSGQDVGTQPGTGGKAGDEIALTVPADTNGSTPAIVIPNVIVEDGTPAPTRTIVDEDAPLAGQPETAAAPDVSIADEATPLAEQPEVTAAPETVIADADVPLAGTPGEALEIAEEDVPLAGLPGELLDINDEEVPLADATPQTSDSSMTSVWLAISLISIGGVIALLKKREEEDNV